MYRITTVRRFRALRFAHCVLGGMLLMASCAANPPQEAPQSLGAKPSYATPAPAPSGTTLYVASGGDDSASGTREDPFPTIEKASSAAEPGTTVIVADGTYEGGTITRASGRADARITYLAEHKWGVRLVAEQGDTEQIEGWGDNEGAVWQNIGDYVDILGFDIAGSTTDGLVDSGSYVRLLENRVHELKESCLSTWSEDYSLHDIDIKGNVVFGCGSSELDHGIYPSHVGGKISNNISYDNAGYGIHCWHNCNELVITNNLVFGNREGGILIGQGDSPNDGDVAADKMLVANNIAVGNGRYGIRESGATGPDNRYLNNDVFGNDDGGLDLRTGSEAATITADPGFVKFAPDGTGDYRLLPTSPNVDAGTDQGAPRIDFAGTARPQGGGVDVGVYER